MSFISNISKALKYMGIPVGCLILFGLIGQITKLNPKVISGIQHLSAGVIASAVASELLPFLLVGFSNKNVWDYVAMIFGFILALVALTLLSIFLPKEDEIENKKNNKIERTDSHEVEEEGKSNEYKLENGEDEKEEEKNDLDEINKIISNQKKSIKSKHFCLKLPLLFIIPLATDTFFDGILLGLSAQASEQAGLVLALAFGIEKGILGLMSSGTLRFKGFSPFTCILVVISLAFLFLLGCIIGGILLFSASGAVFLGLISFGVSAWMYLIIDNLLIEARKIPSSVNWITKSQFYIGFLLVLIFHVATE